jgi:hypothetical protein
MGGARNGGGRTLAHGIAFAILATISAGCSAESPTVSVHGKVSFRGEPITSGVVTFFPVAGRPTSAPLDSDAMYRVELPPGEYTVVVNVGAEVPPGYKEGDPLPPPKLILPPEYTTRAKSKLTASVKEGQTEPINFALD